MFKIVFYVLFFLGNDRQYQISLDDVKVCMREKPLCVCVTLLRYHFSTICFSFVFTKSISFRNTKFNHILIYILSRYGGGGVLTKLRDCAIIRMRVCVHVECAVVFFLYISRAKRLFFKTFLFRMISISTCPLPI